MTMYSILFHIIIHGQPKSTSLITMLVIQIQARLICLRIYFDFFIFMTVIVTHYLLTIKILGALLHRRSFMFMLYCIITYFFFKVNAFFGKSNCVQGLTLGLFQGYHEFFELILIDGSLVALLFLLLFWGFRCPKLQFFVYVWVLGLFVVFSLG